MFLLQPRLVTRTIVKVGKAVLGDILTDRGQRDGFSEAAYRQDKQLLNRQPPCCLSTTHCIAVL